jgi:acyl-coenzyme A synthetase/AMP-(fatty) acid ligase
MHDHFNVSEWLVDRHIDNGDGGRIAVRQGDAEYTYAEVLALVERMAASLRSIGVRPEERVALAMLDSIEFVAAFLGAMRIGAVPVAMNPLLPGRDLGVIVADARAGVLLISTEREDSLVGLRPVTPELHTVVTTGAAGAGVAGWADFLRGGDDTEGAPHGTWADSPGFWLCTSGSTGAP